MQLKRSEGVGYARLPVGEFVFYLTWYNDKWKKKTRVADKPESGKSVVTIGSK